MVDVFDVVGVGGGGLSSIKFARSVSVEAAIDSISTMGNSGKSGS